MKKLINAVEDVVKEQLEGMAVAHPDMLKVHFEPNFVVRADAPVEGKVALISGGGSGHEPMHGGFVGVGMLDGACPGEVFTSPTPDQMYECAKAVNSGEGVLFIVKNYTGDVMNFEMAAEMAAAEGIKVQCILIDDDVAVKDSTWTAGRRGVGTTVLAEKIVGGAAEDNYDLEQCADLCRKVNMNGRSIGMALTSCIVPAAGEEGAAGLAGGVGSGLGFGAVDASPPCDLAVSNACLVSSVASASSSFTSGSSRTAWRNASVAPAVSKRPLPRTMPTYIHAVAFTSGLHLSSQALTTPSSTDSAPSKSVCR